MNTLYAHKVVGLLLRARKYQLVHFEGETLFQAIIKGTKKALKDLENLTKVAGVTDQFRVLGETSDDMLGKD